MSQMGTFNIGFITSITGNSGGAIHPINENINLLGSGGIAINGNTLTGTLTVSGAAFVQQFDTDVSGPIFPIAGIVNIYGGNNITTDGSIAGTIKINVTGTTQYAVQVGNVTGSLTSLAVGANGEGLMGSTGANPSWTGSPSFSGTVTAGTGFTATTGNVAITSGNLSLPTTTATVGQIIVNSVPFMHSYGTDNIFLGNLAGSFTLSATNSTKNIGIGDSALNALVGTNPGEGDANTACGYHSMRNATSAFNNSAYGVGSLSELTSGSQNCSFGNGSLFNILSGSYNLGIGVLSGYNLATNESSNILLNSEGVVGDNNTLRIGAGSGTGVQELNAAYISGIYNKTVGATSTVVLSDSVDKLGGLPSGTAGYVLTQGATAPSWQLNPAIFTWSKPSGNFNLAKSNGYFCDDATLQVVTLPATAAIGDTIKVVSTNTGGWQIVQNASQFIAIGDVSTTPGVGSISSTEKGDAVELVCYVADTGFWIVSSVGNIEYI